MNVTIAKYSGFCFGVDRAMKIVYNEIDSLKVGNSLATYGNIIHNRNVVADLESRGVRTIEDVSELLPNEKVIIRTHGVPNSIFKQLEVQKNPYVDVTCPFVSKIHKIVEEKSKAGYTVLIAGDKNHVEVNGIIGHCVDGSTFYTFESYTELKILLETLSDCNLVVVSQTTFNTQIWKECLKVLSKYQNVEVFDTICNATSCRQSESIELAKKSDVMIIVGGKHSSNTKKLYTVCKDYCNRCYHIENVSELNGIDFSDMENIGITAGASTPAYLIKEVQVHMENLKNNNVENEDFEAMLNESFKKIHTGEKVTAKVVKVEDNEIIVDLGTKHTGYVSKEDLTDDTKLNPSDIVKVDDDIELIVLKVNDADGVAYLSRKAVERANGFSKIVKAHENDETIEGIVNNVVSGGVIASYNGTTIFIPASLVGVPKGEDLNNLLKQKIKFKVIEVDEGKKKAVGSVKAVTKAEREAKEAKCWEDLKVGDVKTGAVKSLTKYGAFVDLGGIDGMVHISELSWKRIRHPKEVVSVGDTIEVYIKDMDKEAGRISLGHKKAEDNPWVKFTTNYSEGDIVEDATIVSITPFGAFAQIIDGVDGLIHVSQISKEHVNNVSDVLTVGKQVKVKIVEIDEEKKRISLSMKAIQD